MDDLGIDWGGKKPQQQQVQLGPGITGTAHGDISGAEMHDQNGLPVPIKGPRKDEGTLGIDWGGSSTGGSTQPKPTATIGAEKHPFEARVNSLMNDLKYGPGVNDNRMPERLMRFIGYQGTQKGQSGNPGAMMPGVGAVEGVPELIHAATKVPQVNSWKGAQRVANEGMGGAFKTLAGVSTAVNPLALVLGMARALPAYAAGSTAAGIAGGDEDTKEFVGDLTGALGPDAARKAGPLIENNAPTIGKVAGYGATAGKMASDLLGPRPHLNPLDLLFASRPVTKTAEVGARLAGKAMGATPGLFPDLPQLDGNAGKQSSEPLQLGRGAITLEPPADTEGMKVQPAQSQIVRNSNTGRMTKQFTTSPADGNGPKFGSEPPLIQTNFGEPKAPPNAGGQVENIGPDARFEELNEKQGSPLEKFNQTTDEIVQNLQGALDEASQSQPRDEKTINELTQELQEWKDYKDRVNQPDYQNPYFNPREEQAPDTSTGNPEASDTLTRGLDEKAPTDESQPLTNDNRSDIINNEMPKDQPENPSRRDFLKTGAKALGAAALPKPLVEGLGKMTEPSSTEAASTGASGFGAADALARQFSEALYGDPDEIGEWYNPDTDFNEDRTITNDEVQQAVGSMIENHIDNLYDMGPHDDSFNDSFQALKESLPKAKEAMAAAGNPDWDLDLDELHQQILDNSGPGEQPKSEQKPLIETNKQPKDIDEKGLQQESRQKFDRDQEAADDHGRKTMYKGMKAGYNPDVESPQPWAQHPFERLIDNGQEDEYEPPEGASASLKGPSNSQNFINPFTGGYEPEPDFAPDELDRLYGNDVQQELINNKENLSKSSVDPKKEFLKNRLRDKGYKDVENVDGWTDQQVNEGLQKFSDKSQEDWQNLRNEKPLVEKNQAFTDKINSFLDQHTGFDNSVPQGEEFHHFEPGDIQEHELSDKDMTDEATAMQHLIDKGYPQEKLVELTIRQLMDLAGQEGFRPQEGYPRSKWTKEMYGKGEE